jgi:hypothetical protein
MGTLTDFAAARVKFSGNALPTILPDSTTAILERWRGGRTIRQHVSIERTAEDVGQPKTATEQLISAHAQALDPLKLLKRRSTDKS